MDEDPEPGVGPPPGERPARERVHGPGRRDMGRGYVAHLQTMERTYRRGRTSLPFTYLAHQAPALAIKRRWPRSFDGTALALGSMAPDWAYALSGTRLALDGHSIWGVIGFCTPTSIIAAQVLRRSAPTLFAYAPNPPQLPLRQLRVLGLKRPPLLTTTVSGAIGALTHVAWDLFTHGNRWGPRHIGWLRTQVVSIAGHGITSAKALQYASHTLGSVGAVLLLSQLLRSGSLLRWYGRERSQVIEPAPSGGRDRFVVLTALGTLGGGVWAAVGDPGLPAQIIRLSLGLAAGLAAASMACRRFVDEVR